jgi:hypothetical protein
MTCFHVFSHPFRTWQRSRHTSHPKFEVIQCAQLIGSPNALAGVCRKRSVRAPLSTIGS